MVRKISELRATPDDVLIAEHDEAARHTSVGTGYYIDELHRREELRAIEAANRLARASFWLTVANLFIAVIAIIIALGV